MMHTRRPASALDPERNSRVPERNSTLTSQQPAITAVALERPPFQTGLDAALLGAAWFAGLRPVSRLAAAQEFVATLSPEPGWPPV